MSPIILASASPRRKQLLEWAEIDFSVMVHPTDESYPPGLAPVQVATHIAREKALAVAKGLDGSELVLAADTIVVLDQMIIGKPADREDGIDILTRLSGRTHHVITGVCLVQGVRTLCFADTTEVSFHTLTHAQIEFYIDRYAPYDKAGAYAIQEWIGVVGIKSVKGDFYNVMGLPVSRVVQELAAWGKTTG